LVEQGTPGTTFGRVAEAYARTRPPYPRAAVERAAVELGLGADATVLDLAAGTGNLTRTLREVFASVVAVEPDVEMRVQFEGDVLPGTAEEIPLADGSVDAVFVGEAFHWFDSDWRDVVDPEGPDRFTEHVRISGRDLVDLHLTGSTPASISDAERVEIAKRAYPPMEDEYDLRVVTELYWKRFA
jgi:SAM-dependent methyltransferase